MFLERPLKRFGLAKSETSTIYQELINYAVEGIKLFKK